MGRDGSMTREAGSATGATELPEDARSERWKRRAVRRAPGGPKGP
jgi:hypothetical protein